METLCSIGHAWGTPRGNGGGGSHSNAREESACCRFSFPSPGRPGRDGHETGVSGAGRGFQNITAAFLKSTTWNYDAALSKIHLMCFVLDSGAK